MTGHPPAIRRATVAPPLGDDEPRLALLAALLTTRPEGIREHELMGLLAARRVPPFAGRGGAGLLDLFQRHFILRHLLYRLRDRLLASGEGDIVLDAIGVRRTVHPGSRDGAVAPPEPLRRYYLDIGELEAMDAATVDDLIDGFWRRYRKAGQREWALEVLGLTSDSSPAAIRRRYRQLAMREHPDRGGNGSRFARINAAYSVLVGSRL